MVIGRVAGDHVVCGLTAFGSRLRARLRDGDLVQPLELGNEPRHRIVQPDLALFDEHHDRDAGDRLRHRGQPEQPVLRHRLLRFEVHHAARFEVGDASLARHECDGTGDVARVDVTLNGLANALQPLGREAHFLGLSNRDRSRPPAAIPGVPRSR